MLCSQMSWRRRTHNANINWVYTEINARYRFTFKCNNLWIRSTDILRFYSSNSSNCPKVFVHFMFFSSQQPYSPRYGSLIIFKLHTKHCTVYYDIYTCKICRQLPIGERNRQNLKIYNNKIVTISRIYRRTSESLSFRFNGLSQRDRSSKTHIPRTQQDVIFFFLCSLIKVFAHTCFAVANCNDCRVIFGCFLTFFFLQTNYEQNVAVYTENRKRCGA